MSVLPATPARLGPLLSGHSAQRQPGFLQPNPGWAPPLLISGYLPVTSIQVRLSSPL